MIKELMERWFNRNIEEKLIYQIKKVKKGNIFKIQIIYLQSFQSK